MINTIKKLLGMGAAADYAQLVKDGAIIVDVRSKGEFAGGHIKGSINIPLDLLSVNLSKLKDKDKPIITAKNMMQTLISSMRPDLFSNRSRPCFKSKGQ